MTDKPKRPLEQAAADMPSLTLELEEGHAYPQAQEFGAFAKTLSDQAGALKGFVANVDKWHVTGHVAATTARESFRAPLNQVFDALSDSSTLFTNFHEVFKASVDRISHK